MGFNRLCEETRESRKGFFRALEETSVGLEETYGVAEGFFQTSEGFFGVSECFFRTSGGFFGLAEGFLQILEGFFRSRRGTFFKAEKLNFMPKKLSYIQYFIAFFIVCGLIFGAGACTNHKTALLTEKVSATENTAERPNATNAEIESALKLIKAAPNSSNSYVRLSSAYIRLARQTGDFSLNSKAEAAVIKALEIQPDALDALKLKTSLHLTMHRFAEARAMAAELNQKHPRDAFFYGALTDANVELGNYEEALNAAQKMVDMKPDMTSYVRVSQMRSLYGDPKGAIEAMSLAARIADPNDAEARAWCLAQLGNEYFKTGDFNSAGQAFDNALTVLPDYYLALAGKGRALAAQGDFVGAIKFLQQSQDRVPATETVLFLADVYTSDDAPQKARSQYELAEAIESKLGDSSDQRRLALLWADQDKNLDEALTIARREYASRKDIYTADILAWCLYKKGEHAEARKVIGEAMRLKTKDARIFYHAGMIEKALGNKQAAAKYLNDALKTNPAFDLIQAENAKRALES